MEIVRNQSIEARDGDLLWYALQVRSRRETQVASQLEQQGIECFLPMATQTRRWSDRIKSIKQPLFPGYLFSRFDFHHRRPLLMTPGVVQIVGVGRNPIPVETTELDAIKQALAAGLPSEPWPYLQVGERVRVTIGGMSSLEGVLVSFKGSHRIVLSMTLLRRSVAVEIDSACVTPVRDDRPASQGSLFGCASASAAISRLAV